MNLRELREQKSFTQTELAAACEVTAQAVWAWERGQYEPSLIKQRKIAQFLGVSLDEVRSAIKQTVAQKSS